MFFDVNAGFILDFAFKSFMCVRAYVCVCLTRIAA